MIIDVHGHYTTAPAALGAWRDLQIAALKDPSQKPKASDLKISDDEIRETIEDITPNHTVEANGPPLALRAVAHRERSARSTQRK